MTTRLIIARHGNTFRKGDVVTRVGGRTDLPLVEEEKGTNLGKCLKENKMIPDVVFAAPLKRTMETARLAIKAMEKDIPLIEENSFREIDYGPDENKPEEEVIARIGEKALSRWNRKAIVPDGWNVNPEELAKTWIKWGNKIEQEYHSQTVMIVSSNGIIRFAPHLTGEYDTFCKENGLKVGTGCFCVFEKEYNDLYWRCVGWNVNPKEAFFKYNR